MTSRDLAWWIVLVLAVYVLFRGALSHVMSVLFGLSLVPLLARKVRK